MGLYFPSAHITRFYDPRRLNEIMSDTGSPEVGIGYLTNEAYLEAVRGAEAEVDENLQVGGHYDKQVLIDACTAADVVLGIGATAAQILDLELAKRRVAPLREMIAHLVFGKLMMRRGYAADTMREMSPMYEAALERLERLASGHKVFDFVANITAGIPARVNIGSQLPTGANFNAMFGVWPTSGGFIDGAFGNRWR